MIFKRKTLVSHIASIVLFLCSLYKANHLLYQCSTFLKQTLSQRFEFVKIRNCVNCFTTKRSVKACTNSRVDSVVTASLLHFNNSVRPVDTQSSTSAPTNSESITIVATHLLLKTIALSFKIQLAIVLVRIYLPHKRFITVRTIFDQESVSKFISKSTPTLFENSLLCLHYRHQQSSCDTLPKLLRRIATDLPILRPCLYFDH